MDAKEIFKRLREPFPQKTLKWRVGSMSKDRTSGKALPYIDARHVQNRLDEVVGPENWQTELTAQSNGSVFVCKLSLRINGEWLSKSDGAQIDDYAEDAHGNAKEVALKGAMSDALKRAAVQWGIGRYLYEYDAPWVPLDDKQRLTKTPALPPHMLPEAERRTATRSAPKSLPKPQAAAPARSAATLALPASAQASAPEDKPAAGSGAAPAADAGNEHGNVVPMPAPKTASVSMAAIEELPDEIRQAGLNDEQLARVRFVLEKIRTKKAPPTVLTHFINGERNTDLPAQVRAKMLELIEHA